MRVGLIGDVHAEDELLRVAIDELRRGQVDQILCTGDVVDGHGDVDRSCELLREASVVVIRGNHDRWIRADEMRSLPLAHKMTDLSVETITFLKMLPPVLSFDIAATAGKLVLCHGVGHNDMVRLQADDRGYALSSNEDLLKLLFDTTVHVMVGGHTHRTMVRRFERGPGKPPLFAVNPGTLAREHEPGFAILDLTGRRVDFHRFTSDGRASHASNVKL